MFPYITIDTETTGLDVYKGARPFLYIAKRSWEPDTIVTYSLDEFKEYLKPHESIAKVFHNAQFDLGMLEAVGYKVQGPVYCTMVMKHLIDGGVTSNSLKACSEAYLPAELWKRADLVEDWFKENRIKKADRRYDHVPEDIMYEYAKYDVIATEALFMKFWNALEQRKLINLLYQEMEFVHTALAIYNRGLMVDVDYLLELKDKYQQLIEESHAKMLEIAGKPFNINSGKQVAEILAEQGYEMPKTEKGNYVTNKSEIKKHQHPLLIELTRYRNLTKIRKTYVEGLLEAQVDGFIHPSLRNTTAVTGRLSCVNPNVQNLPKKDKVIRRAFVPRPGYVNFYIDWKQQEYRVFASYAGETDILHQINEFDADFHTLVMEAFPQYFKGNRDMVKTFNFMLIYGGGVAKLAAQLGISMEESRSLKREYFKRFKNVDNFFTKVKETAIARGFVFNKFGRRYYLPVDKFGNTQEYKLVNYLIQGSCADYVKMVMNKLEVYFKDKPQNILLQVHDEFCIESPIGDYSWLPDVIAIMEDSMRIFGVRLGVDVEVAVSNWSEKLEWDMERMEPKYEEVDTTADYSFEEEGTLCEEWAA